MTARLWGTAALVLALLVGFAPPVAAGPISVFTQVLQAEGSTNDEIPFSGLGSFGILTTGGDVNPVVTVPANQTSARQPLFGYWPVLGFSTREQYEAQRGTVATIPETRVRLHAEVYNGDYSSTSPVQILSIEAFV